MAQYECESHKHIDAREESGESSTIKPKLRASPLAEDQEIVPDDIE